MCTLTLAKEIYFNMFSLWPSYKTYWSLFFYCQCVELQSMYCCKYCLLHAECLQRIDMSISRKLLVMNEYWASVCEASCK